MAPKAQSKVSKISSKAPARRPDKAKSQALARPSAMPKTQPAQKVPAMAKTSPSVALTTAPVTPTLQKPEEGPSPVSMTPKNFRNHPDMENFFRFIYENDLRIEALHIIDHIIAERKVRRASRKQQPNA